jgi:hypothetical protein
VLDCNSEGFCGPWAVNVSAENPDAAEAAATGQMLATLHEYAEDDDDEEDA